ncbi:MAG: isoprenylcysteine carboxylmethyltransferase family protein [Geobacteraceae bacterium]
MKENAVRIDQRGFEVVLDDEVDTATYGATQPAPELMKKGNEMRSVSESFAFRNRGRIGLALVLPLIALILFSRPLVAENSPLGIALNVAAWFMFGLYVTFRIWSTLFIGARKDSTLQQEGPYSVTRNPLYFGTFCFAMSAVLLCKSIALAVVMLIGFLFYSRFVIRAEESFLAGRYGQEFTRFLQRTPRFIPSFSSYRSPETVNVSVAALRSEAKRLWIALLFPVAIQALMLLRMSPGWPHWFNLP